MSVMGACVRGRVSADESAQRPRACARLNAGANTQHSVGPASTKLAHRQKSLRLDPCKCELGEPLRRSDGTTERQGNLTSSAPAPFISSLSDIPHLGMSSLVSQSQRTLIPGAGSSSTTVDVRPIDPSAAVPTPISTPSAATAVSLRYQVGADIAPPRWRFPKRRVGLALFLLVAGFCLLVSGLAVESLPVTVTGAVVILPGLYSSVMYCLLWRGDPRVSKEGWLERVEDEEDEEPKQDEGDGALYR